MDVDGDEGRERSEPCSARTNPFTENDAFGSRKRQKILNGSVEASLLDKMLEREDDVEIPPESSLDSRPSLPTSQPSESNSSKVTINLRTHPSAKETTGLQTEPAPAHGTSDAEVRKSTESESDALSSVSAVETPSRSFSGSSSPRVELVTVVDDHDELEAEAPPLAIIEDDEDLDIMEPFPGARINESSSQAVLRMARHFQYDEIDNPECFCLIRDWIDGYLERTRDIVEFHNAYHIHRDVWIKIPEVFNALSRRSRFFGVFLQRSREGRKALSDMFAQFSRLSARFLVMDVETLERTADGADEPPNLVSYLYLRAYSLLLRKEESSHIGRNLETHYNWDWDVDMMRMSDCFRGEGGTLTNLTRLVRVQTRILESNSKIAEHFTEPCRIVAKILGEAPLKSRTQEAQLSLLTPEQKVLVAEGYKFFKLMSSGLQVIIEKHVTSISPEAALLHLTNLASIYSRTLTCDNPETNEVIQSFHKAHPDIPLGACATKAIPYTWKINMLQKLITSTQMQLRVNGVTTMCADLLQLYGLDKDRLEPYDNPLLLHIAELIISHQLIDYIVGVGSHPEIINESNNIVGFLIVTRTYTNQDTDRIWHTVMTSQDPRLVAATLRLLCRLLHLLDLPQTLHLCQKLDEIPVQAFNVVMRDLCRQIMDWFVSKWRDGSQSLQPTPYNLCVRLIRDSSISTDEGTLVYPELNTFALEAMQALLPFGPPADSRSVIYRSCMNDISSGSVTSLGSTCLINLLLRRTPDDLLELATSYDLTRLLIQTLENQGNGSEPFASSHQELSHGLSRACVETLMRIISTYPDTISPELGHRLWNVLVGSTTKSSEDRNNSWATLNSVMVDSVTKQLPNKFLISCFDNYFPTLPASCFISGALEFVRVMIDHWMEEFRTAAVLGKQDPDVTTPQLEQLWRMILTAPSNTIENTAIKVLVQVYVDSDLILTLSRAKARVIHQNLLERCLNQLKVAASKLKESELPSTTLTTAENEAENDEKTFARSLAVLREFLKAYQSKPQFATPKPPPRKVIASSDTVGKPLDVYYQSFDGDKQTEIKKFTLGTLSTAATLLTNLQEATGFKNYKLYFGGKPFLPNEYDVCRSLEELNLTGLVLVQRCGDTEDCSNKPSSVPLSLEHQIVQHMDELWNYLGMHDKVAQEIHYFLVKFPVYGNLMDIISSESTSYREIFPASQPFKSLYAVHAIREAVTNPDADASYQKLSVAHAVTLIVAVLCDIRSLDDCANEETKGCLVTDLIDCLIQLLRQDDLPGSVEAVLTNALFERMLHLLTDSQAAAGSHGSSQLTIRIFEAILEASLHSSEFWEAVASKLRKSELLQQLVLHELQPIVRKSIVKQIIHHCTYSREGTQLTINQTIATFWPLTANLIPEAIRYPRQCEELFVLGLALFREGPVQPEDLDGLVRDWSELLVGSEQQIAMCNEHFDSPDLVDPVALGLANLLQAATLLAKASQQPLECGVSGVDIFCERLFPDLTKQGEIEQHLRPRLPILHPGTRERLEETVFSLVKDDSRQYIRLLETISTLEPYSAGAEFPYSFDLNFGFDRNYSIRSPTGYSGLKNLSNTCYLNSLFAQLYMNIPFRNFILNLRTRNNNDRHKLLLETQGLFSYMQNSLGRFVNPEHVASSIQTYDLTQIDVSIQMDVDEFYNLLFDRWESQMPTVDAKQTFKSFYGGQLVQQVKSKECSHISEREESFSAIQCEIKGKTCLQESLQAYVEGEVMEGDNKYKCSTCDRHVDAVKRACLKEIPDSLIFHLKRFDFNLRTLQRSKINDHFAFPRTIDMRPYTVDFLMDRGAQIPEDIFELVGVLVHSGTAESGHYYSYVRERPSSCGHQPWVEFNDEIVTTWDSGTMEACCFGGPDLRPGSETVYDKSYSAYMLFYQRASTLVHQHQTLVETNMSSPVRLKVPTNVGSLVAMENELILRKYCLYEPAYTIFLSKMLGNARKLNGGRCSKDHQIEKDVLTAALSHLDQVVARTKDLPQFVGFLGAINRICQTCAECSRDYLEYFIKHTEALRQLVLRNPDFGVRSEIATSSLGALKKVKADAAYAYGFNDDTDPSSEEPPRLIHKFIRTVDKLFETFHTNTRAWPEFFGLLVDIANLGREEAAVLLDNQYLRKTLAIICADPALATEQQYLKMWSNVSKRMATRPISYEAILALLHRLLQSCDGSTELTSDSWDRASDVIDGRPVPLSESERHLLGQQWSKTNSNILADKLLRINQNEYATQAIIAWLIEWLKVTPNCTDHGIRNAIFLGLQRSAPVPALAPFIRAALTYCEVSDESDSISTTIQEVANAAYSAEQSEGKACLHFFLAVIKLPKNSSNVPRDEIIQLVRRCSPIWGPALLASYDAVVREGAENLIHELILRHGSEAESNGEEEENVVNVEVVRAARQLATSCLEYIEETYIQQRVAAISANMLVIQIVIESLSGFFSDEDDDTELDGFHQRKERVLGALKRCLVDEIEEEASEWEASDEYPSSEPEYNDGDAGI